MRVKPIAHLKMLEFGFLETSQSFFCMYTKFDYLFWSLERHFRIKVISYSVLHDFGNITSHMLS